MSIATQANIGNTRTGLPRIRYHWRTTIPAIGRSLKPVTLRDA